MVIQQGAFFLTICCWIVWIVASLGSIGNSYGDPKYGFNSSLGPGLVAINSDPDTGSQASVLGTILFNFGFVTTVPSWINEKHRSVSVNSSLWVATTLCIIVFFVIGMPAAAAFSDVLQGPTTGTCAFQVTDDSFNCANDLMQLLSQKITAPFHSSSAAIALFKISVCMFPVVAVVSSIPVFSIVIKYNLIENGFSSRAGFLWGVVFPWAVAFPLLYMPGVLADLINLTSIVFVSFTDFIVPFALYIKLMRKQKRDANSATFNAMLSTNTAHLLSAAIPTNSSSRHPIPLNAPNEIGARLSEAEFKVAVATGGVVGDAGDAEGDAGEHSACPGCPGGYQGKAICSVLLSTILAMLSLVAFILSIQQGNWAIDAQTCATVGS
uniref:Amino acid transporter transmembrane domain-containing protein n=1 Tax=Haptolina ericina TaxID=156174 RepID=A0A7S3EZB0_9EUKA|eukprot:CAMPEP_0181198088 /NCGR_PEP_ID=MMETSP1096-20121128/16417_1 /TAXON_ID=156174 ORGANISM="Chrysochromulina ericina, Strain CCMP281" /NCGR_SAMPLE_ID=MMETSP1096 /ASSEMBLY_ACC=CAM_ASM_000453 /LENGTH=380 /DNA_ID=CAMNT_0023288101 /DNA_START=151 /DNA_END=1293 /DNA_ORIENTATION=+